MDLVVPRLLALTAFMGEAAAAGDELVARHVREGHQDHYLRDARYVEERMPTWHALVVAG